MNDLSTRQSVNIQASIAKSAKLGYWFIGTVIIVLAVTSLITQLSLMELLEMLNQHFGKTFSLIFFALFTLCLYAWFQLNDEGNQAYWFEVGSQAANGISTLALTFTLFGISMGIGALSDKSLTPENVEQIISELTSQFSLAFMTTVVGLPSAALLRALISIKTAKLKHFDRSGTC